MEFTSESRFEDLEQKLFHMSLDQLKRRMEYDARTKRLWGFLERRYADPELNLTEASKQAGMSKNTLNTVLKHLTGHTFGSLLRSYRLYLSIRVILLQNVLFTDAAGMCGFDNSSSYSRAFKRILKVSPRDALPRGQDYIRELALPRLALDRKRRRRHLLLWQDIDNEI